MNGDCDKMKDRVADLMSGILPESQTHELRQHLGKCSACKGYAKALQEEDQLLAGLFAKLDASMKGREDEIINTISRLDKSGQSNIISVWRMTVKTLLAKHAAAAAVIAAVTAYFIITLTWISQINEVIRHGL